MAWFKYQSDLRHSQGPAYDQVHEPGSATPNSGIYRCTGCGREVTSVYGHPLPTQNHHQHTYGQGAIRWRLVVYADHEPKAA